MPNEEFNPMRDVPKNEEQVLQALRYGRDPIVAASLVGIFQVKMAMGESLLDAYEAALLAHVEAYERRREN